ncbi:MAG: AraC family transcriptional regulator [Clostridiales Family XIII bacterium]|jgi:AraC-like DNA-binding protein|nr:AraC family transcriptional regulator [Clostridiales Family XIII bacterium]
MHANSYFEKLNFSDGKKINVSNRIDISFCDTIHWHPFVEILLCLSENNEVTINFTDYILNTNDLVIIYPGDLHSLRNIDENAFVLVQLPMDLLMIMSEFSSNYHIFYQYHCIKYNPTSIDSDKMISLIKELPSLYYSEIPFKEVRIYSLLLELFIKLGQYCINAKKEDLSNNESVEYKTVMLITDACLYISQNCTKALTLDDISHHVGFSKFHFAHLFKTYMNMTFIDFLTAERIKKAESLISNPKTPITDIAFDSGFSSLSSFNRAFKKHKGISPSEFRKMIKPHSSS